MQCYQQLRACKLRIRQAPNTSQDVRKGLTPYHVVLFYLSYFFLHSSHRYSEKPVKVNCKVTSVLQIQHQMLEQPLLTVTDVFS